MKDNKVFISGIVFMIVGIIGGGLFAIANSLDIMAANLENSKATATITCGIILFILLGLAIAGFVMMIKELTKKEEKK